MRFPRVWPDTRPGIYGFIRDRLQPIPGDDALPDNEEFNKDKKLRFTAGASDGVALRHGVRHHGDESDEARAAAVLAAVKEAIREPIAENIGRLYGLLIEDRTIDFIEAFLSLLAEDRVGVSSELPTLARWLATEAPDRGVVKFGLALLGRCGDFRDAEILITLGRHEEFTLYASVALSEVLIDPEPTLWELAKQVHGWGRIHLVERLGSTTNEAIKRWMLREGYKNRIMTEYLAYCCATTGGLIAALRDPEPDERLLAGAGDIIEGLLSGRGTFKDIDDYADGAEAVLLYLKHVARRPTKDLTQFTVFLEIKAYVEDATIDWDIGAKQHWTESVRRDVAHMAGAILGREEWRVIAQEGLLSQDKSVFRMATFVLEKLGIDTWEASFERLRSGKSEEPPEWFMSMRTYDSARMDRVIALAEERLDLRAIASGPAEELGFGTKFRQHSILRLLLQGLDRFPGKGWKLVTAALRSPVVSNRNGALRVLAAWKWKESAWSQEASALLERALAEEPDAEVRQRIRNVLDGRSLDDGISDRPQTIH